MKSIKKILLSLAGILAMGCLSYAQVTPGPANQAGLLYASNFSSWTVPQGNVGPYSWSSPQACTVTSGGISFKAFTVGTPVTLVDTVNSAHTEVVTPTAVNVSGAGCSITINPIYSHTSFYFTTSTGGLQEAINWAGTQLYSVILTPDWTRAGGVTGDITAATGNANVSILDQRNSCLIAYAWSGSAYAEQANFCTGGGSGVTSINTVAGAFTFTGAGVSCTGTTCTFAGGTTVNVNGSAVSNPNFNGSTPAPDPGYTQVTWKVSGSSVLGEVPSSASGSGTLGFIPLWTPNGTTLGNSHLDDGITTAGTITSSEPLVGTSSSATTLPLLGRNIASSSGNIVGSASDCPNLGTGSLNTCDIATGELEHGGDGYAAVFTFKDNGSSATNRGMLSMGHSESTDITALQWDIARHVYLMDPALVSQSCIGTGANGEVIPGTCSGAGGSGTGFNGALGSSYQDAAEIAAPANPSAGNDRLYLDSTTHQLTCHTSAGASCLPAGGGAPTGTGVPLVSSGAWTTTLDMGTVANIPLVSGSDHLGHLASGTISTGGTGTSVLNLTSTTISQLGTITGLVAGSTVQVTDGASCGDTGTGGGTVMETLRYTGSAWGVIACGPTGGVTANGLFSAAVYLPTTTGTGFTTALNQSATFSATNNATGITFAETTPQSGTNAVEGIVKAYPGSPFTLTYLFALPQPSANTVHFGIVVTTTALSSSPAMEYFWGYQTGAMNGPQLNGVTNLTASSSGTVISAAISELRWPSFIWLRWADDGTNITVSYSEDGSFWVQQYSVAKSASYLGSSGFGEIGAFLYNGAGGATGATLLSVH